MGNGLFAYRKYDTIDIFFKNNLTKQGSINISGDSYREMIYDFKVFYNPKTNVSMFAIRSNKNQANHTMFVFDSAYLNFKRTKMFYFDGECFFHN